MVTQAMAACLAQLNGGGLAVIAAGEVAGALGVSGAGVSLHAENGIVLTWGDDPVTVELAELQLTLGEGPVIDAATGDMVVLEPRLTEVPEARWSAFAIEAAELGVQAVFVFPLRHGAIRLGVLVLHRATAGALTTAQLADALTFADAATLALLTERQTAPAVSLPDELGGHGVVVAQATGMISVQLGIDVGEALVRLRGYAYGSHRPIGEVAADVVARWLRFDDPQT